MSYPDRPGDDLVIFGGHIVLMIVGYIAVGTWVPVVMIVLYGAGSILNIWNER